MTNLENMSYIKDPICMGFVLSNGKANRIAKIYGHNTERQGQSNFRQ